MKAVNSAAPVLRDLWTNSVEYRRLHQPPDEIEEVARLLEMETATALLDVGCGNGVFGIAAARVNPACRLYAFDALQSAVNVCRTNATRELGDAGVTCAIAAAHQIPLPDAAVDRILCRAVLHHLPDPHAAFREFARLLRPGGLLLLQAPCNYWQAEWGQVISDLYMFDDDSHRRQYHQPATVIAALNAAGLAMRSARCWPYLRENLKPAEVDFIKRYDAVDRFQLRQEGDGTWSCALYWLRVIASRI